MDRLSDSARIPRLIDRLVRCDLPSAVHLANESGNPESSPGVLAFPRFSLCLSGEAVYRIVREGEPADITVRRGEAICVAPGSLMEPHPAGRYLALGIVFTPEMTRFLIAKKIPGSHRFLVARHSSRTIDTEAAFLFKALVHPTESGQTYLRKLLQLLLIKSRSLADGGDPDNESRKAWFTWRSACQFLEEHFTAPIDRNDVAAFLRLHPNHVSRLFSRFGDGTFNRHLLRLRLRHASKLLADPTLNIGEIARASGFTDANYFIRRYHSEFGVTPGKTRQRTIDS